ncbi:MAG: RDD family protein [Nevskiales bacterium]|nr:RDD family protein [Nevskiales bacterium]
MKTLHSPVTPAPLWRRLAAALYDGFLLLAVWVVAVFLDVLIRDLTNLPYDTRVFRAYLFLVGLLFFTSFWTRGGQTLGMRVWQLQLRRTDGRALGILTACTRYAFAWLAWLPLGLGVFWSALDPQRRAWHDRLSGTEMIVLRSQPGHPGTS